MEIHFLTGFEGTGTQISLIDGSDQYYAGIQSGIKRTGGWAWSHRGTGHLFNINYTFDRAYAADGKFAATIPPLASNTHGRFYFLWNSGDNNRPFCKHGSTSNDLTYRLNNNRVEAYTGTDVLVGTSASTISPSSWHMIESRVINNIFDLNIDGNVEITGQSFIGSDYRTFLLGSPQSVTSPASFPTGVFDFYYDDAIVGSGSNSEWIGPGKVATLYPSATGTYSAWAAGTGNSLGDYRDVDDFSGVLTHDIDSSYLITSVADDKHSVRFPATLSVGIAAGSTINAVRYLTYCRDENQVNNYIIGIKSPSGETYTTASDGYVFYDQKGQILQNNPNTSVVWTLNDIDNIEVVVQKTTVPSRNLRYTASVLMLDYREPDPVSPYVAIGNLILYKIRSILSQNRNEQWDSRSILENNRNTNWRVLSLVENNKQILWNTFQNLISVAESKLILWDVLSPLHESRNESWNVRNTTTGSGNETWNVRSIIDSSKREDWNVRSQFSVNTNEQWNVLGGVDLGRFESWGVRALLDKNNFVKWNVNGPFSVSNILYKFSIKTGSSGNALNQSDPNQSLGKNISTNEINSGVLNNLFDNILGGDNAASIDDYRCIFVHNSHDSSTMNNVKVWLTPYNGADKLVGKDPFVSTLVGFSGAQAVEISDELSSPTGVSFSTPTDFNSSIDIGSISPGYCKALWLKRDPNNIAINNETVLLTLNCGVS